LPTSRPLVAFAPEEAHYHKAYADLIIIIIIIIIIAIIIIIIIIIIIAIIIIAIIITDNSIVSISDSNDIKEIVFKREIILKVRTIKIVSVLFVAVNQL
jgi:hypothetical protein